MGLHFDENGIFVPRRDPRHPSNLLRSICIPTTESTTLGKEYAVVKRLKELFPYSGLPSIRPNFIHIFAKPTRLCQDTGIASSYAHYHSTPPYRICINAKFQSQLTAVINDDEAAALNRPDLLWYEVTGDLAIILIITHELAHHDSHVCMCRNQHGFFSHICPYGHGKEWKENFAKLFGAIINDIKSK